MRLSERDIGSNGKLPHRIHGRFPATEAEQQITDRKCRKELLGVGGDIAVRNQVAGKRQCDALMPPMALAVSTGRNVASAISTCMAACRACSHATRVAWSRRSAVSISSTRE